MLPPDFPVVRSAIAARYDDQTLLRMVTDDGLAVQFELSDNALALLGATIGPIIELVAVEYGARNERRGPQAPDTAEGLE